MAEKGKYIYDWPRPMVTVDAVVFNLSGGKTQVLLVNRGKEPYKGKWAVPGGFIEIDEELENAVARELKEETGLTAGNFYDIFPKGKMKSQMCVKEERPILDFSDRMEYS